jgi:hypothetical protein
MSISARSGVGAGDSAQRPRPMVMVALVGVAWVLIRRRDVT